ncbi:MAG TPA: hypothetical protein VEW25_02325 [Allosphingosinicella sp.]|nr:hypothetical protein [Allosphingosinicella sp.]
MNISNGLRAGGAIVAIVLAGGCSASVASLDCSEIADQAKAAGEGQAIRLSEVRNVREESRSEREARCVGEASWSNNATSDVYLRAYESENGSTMVEYRNMPYPEAPLQ